MLHWVPPPALAFVGARGRGPALPGDVDRCVQQLRAVHATMLAYAAQRRRAAGESTDSHYWKAAESHALGKARAVRASADFPRLP
jgi:hypothetical protein